MLRLVLCFCLLAALCAAEPPSQTAELERLNSLVEQLTALKAEVAQVQAKIDVLLQSLSEQRGALQVKPAAYNALNNVLQDSSPDAKKVLVRCAAITSSGARCSRAAVDSSRYCKQHQVAHQK